MICRFYIKNTQNGKFSVLKTTTQAKINRYRTMLNLIGVVSLNRPINIFYLIETDNKTSLNMILCVQKFPSLDVYS